jgi:parallel beta-helix repeat protein
MTLPGPALTRTGLAVALLIGLAPMAAAQDAPVPFRAGMVVTQSVTIRPGRYFAPAGHSGAIVVRGEDIVLDLSGVELVGSDSADQPNRFLGTAIRIDGGRNVTVRGARIRGYKVGILARGTRGLTLAGNDLSHNWRPRLYSGIERESLVDWLSYHKNERGEWLRFGAAIYLVDVEEGEIRDNIVRQGMNALLLTRSTGLTIWNNDFSFNSGLGIGLYRSSGNLIAHNRADWNVRGYSHGFFNRGQDSAALLLYEQSSGNIVAYNSMTHSGDGLFLWAGQHTMDTGEGGSNDNLFYRNDFSFAPTNGMEATFSRNYFIANRVEGSWHGLWGGYSWESLILGNEFSDNVEAIAIEHGQKNRIAGNTFTGDTTAIHLWWNRIEPSDWGYPKHRDTRSYDYGIESNTFSGNRVALRARDTQSIGFRANTLTDVDTALVARGDTAGFSSADSAAAFAVPERYTVRPLAGGRDVLASPDIRRGRDAIIVDEWGPYDWRSPRLWPAGRSDATPLPLRVLGPPGQWRVVAREGIGRISPPQGKIGDTIFVSPAPGREADFSLQLEYRGAATVSPFGDSVPANGPVRFGWTRFRPKATWSLRFVPLDSAAAPPADTSAVRTLLDKAPAATADTTRLDLMWYRPPRPEIPQARVLTEATASVRLAGGRYRLRTIADDAIRVWVDDELVVDDWKPGESRVRETILSLGGAHAFRVDHLQLDGWYELRLDIERADE